jgi:hypothetical protein
VESRCVFLIHMLLKAGCVYEDEEEVLVLGKPFVSKRRHYWEDKYNRSGS